MGGKKIGLPVEKIKNKQKTSCGWVDILSFWLVLIITKPNKTIWVEKC